jgi:ABC-type sulfate/molybdate transport systems ATPase subunit
MRQRVAIARTLAAGSEILLMDEPFGALDAQRREFLQLELRRIQLEEGKTVVFVTHDVEEAAFLADRVIVFTRRPARILAEVDVTARLGSARTLELRESPEFFALRNELLHHVRSTATEEEEGMTGLDGQRVLVTGASRGIGLGVARRLRGSRREVWALAEDEAVRRAARRSARPGFAPT